MSDEKYTFRIGDQVWYTLERQYGWTGEHSEYQARACIEVLCEVVNLTGKRVMLRKVGDGPKVKPFAVLADKVW